MYIIFDTETTGLPKNWNEPISNFDNWPRIVQIAWKVYDENHKCIETHDYIIKPNGFIILKESTAIHRISHDKAVKEGVDLKIALDKFGESIEKSKYLIAHNISFDEKVVGSELLRLGLHNYIYDIFHVCTKETTIDFVKITSTKGLKWPTLTELYTKLFTEAFKDAHNALVDVEALARCFFELINKGWYSFGKDINLSANIKQTKEFVNKNYEQDDKREYVPLGLHTFYSTLQTAGFIDEYIKISKEKKYKAIGITDNGNFSGTFEFYQKCKSEGIKSILGIELYVNDNIGKFEKKIEEGDSSKQRIFIKNQEGFVNLNKIIYKTFSEGYYRVGRAKTEWIKENKNGFILTTSSLNGVIGNYIKLGKEKEAEEYLKEMLDVFGEDYYAEIQFSQSSRQKVLNKFIIIMAKKYSMKTVLINDVYYCKPEDYKLQNIVCAINNKSTVDRTQIPLIESLYYFDRSDFYKKNKEYCYNYNEDFIAQCLHNTLDFEAKCNFEFETDVEKYPKYEPTPDVVNHFKTTDTKEIITRLAHAKLNKKMEIYKKNGIVKVDDEVIKKYRDRLDYELKVIDDKKMLDYFLVVWELINFCGKNDIEVGPGRGSVCGSLLSWCLDVTKIDSIRFDLYFERFLNYSRKGVPDIDSDYQANTDEKTLQFLFDKYGKERIFPVVTFSTFSEKGCLKDVVRALGGDTSLTSDVAYVTKEMPYIKWDCSLEEWFKTWSDNEKCSDKVRSWLLDENNKHIMDITIKLQGQVRGLGKHAAGIVITPGPVWESIPPVNMVSGFIVSGFQESGNGKDLSTLGILKLDRLKLSTLNIKKETIKLIKEKKGKDISNEIDFINLEDENLYKELLIGNNCGIFQFESEGINSLVKHMKISKFDELVAANAIYRPGTLGIGAHEEYVKNKFNPEKAIHVHSLLIPLLEKTNGVLIYQEQLMFIASEIGGMTLGEGDNLRKVMDAAGKIIAKAVNKEILTEDEKKNKNYKQYLELWEKFKSGAKKKGMSEKEVTDVESWLIKYLGYSFNKCLSKNHIVISKERGEINLLDVKIGESVLGYNSKLKKEEYNIVKKIHKNGIKKLYKIKTESGKVLECTLDHKIMTEDGMKSLSYIIENKLKIITNTTFENIIENIEIEEQETYDLEIGSEFHNYYANGICVSNSHALAYSYITAQTLFLKHYYPTEFYTSLLNNSKSTGTKEEQGEWISMALLAAMTRGIKIVPPNRKSNWDWTMLDDNTIAIGFSSINGMGEIGYNEIKNLELDKMTKEQFFATKFSKFTKKNFDACVKAGIFDDWSDSRDMLIEMKKIKIKTNDSQLDLFGSSSADIINDFVQSKNNFLPTSAEEKNKDFLETCKINLEFLHNITQLKSYYLIKHEVVLEPVTHFENINSYYYFFLEKIEKRKTVRGKDFYDLSVNDGFGKKKLKMWSDMYNKNKSILTPRKFFVTKFVKQNGFLNFNENGPLSPFDV